MSNNPEVSRRSFLTGPAVAGAAALAAPPLVLPSVIAGQCNTPPQHAMMYNVCTDFGAVGDGVADDTTAVQCAIDATAASGGTVAFPAGIYKLTRGLTLPDHGGINLVGASQRDSVLRFSIGDGTGIKKALLPQSRGYFWICDLCIENSAWDKRGVALDLTSLWMCTVEKVKIGGFNTGIRIADDGGTGTYWNRIVNNNISDCATGVQVTRGSGIASNQHWIQYNVIGNFTSAGVSILTSMSNVVEGNNIETNFATAATYGVDIQCDHNLIIANHVEMFNSPTPPRQSTGIGINMHGTKNLSLRNIFYFPDPSGTAFKSDLNPNDIIEPDLGRFETGSPINLCASDQGLNGKLWQIIPTGNILRFRTRNDDGTGGGDCMRVFRNGPVVAGMHFVAGEQNIIWTEGSAEGWKAIGFFGHIPNAQPVIYGSRGGNEALGDLIGKLASIGLVVDETTP